MYNDDDFKDEEVEDSESSQTSGNKLLDFYEANKKLIWILGGIIIFILIKVRTFFEKYIGGIYND